MTFPASPSSGDTITATWGDEVVTFLAGTKPFSYNDATSTLASGIIGYYGGYLADGTHIADGTITISGTSDTWIYINSSGTVASGTTIPSGNSAFLKVPYSSGWQPPVDVRPIGSIAAAIASSGQPAANWYQYDGMRDRVVSELNNALSADLSGSWTDFYSAQMVALDSSRVLLVYKDNTSAWSAVVGTLSGVNMTWGTVLVLSSSPVVTASTDIRLAKINTDKAILTWNAGTNTVKAVVLSVSGSTVSAGTAQTVDSSASGTSGVTSLCQVNTDKALVITYEASTLKAFVLSVSGTTITVGSGATVVAASVNGVWVSQVDTDAFLTVYGNSTANEFDGKLGTISGTTIALGSATQLATTVAPTDVRCVAVTATEAITTYYSSGLYAQKCTISGTTLTKTGGSAVLTTAPTGTGTGIVGVTSKAAMMLDNTLNTLLLDLDTTTSPNIPILVASVAMGTYSGTAPSTGALTHSGLPLVKLDSSTLLAMYPYKCRLIRL